MKSSKTSFETQKKKPNAPATVTYVYCSLHQNQPRWPKKRHITETDKLPPMDNTARNKNNHKDPLFTTQRKMKRNHTELSKGVKGSPGGITNNFPVLSLPNGTFKSRKPLINSERQNSKKYYLEKTKRLKHKADAMMDKAGNTFLYLAEAALLFPKYGIALKLDALEPKSVYSIFSNTIVLIKFIMTLKPFADSSVSSHGKIFAML
ncbi:hypothetical protein DUI87_05945 [Hirundo rustica rustica]|uniref:AF4/FMR2 C-terminal homology domain-containing protein n=1 Tax=Hirundo rustica rustica TaxID=333673 RepID=A0A3M0L0R6_HIRRU|nr:hypothetical protein DUI87_05945 [Hirundo rustica rustica]